MSTKTSNMAELVQTFLENMIPEMEQMELLGLFTKPEVSKILRRRRAFEYKLRRTNKKLNDYTDYIQYEQNVLSLVRVRRKKIGCKLKKEMIEVAIIRRIHRLFGQATKRFPRDIQTWLSHIKFAKMQKEKGSVSRIVSKMLRAHNRQPELWILAAKYEFEDNNDSETTRKLFHRGLQLNSDSKILWLEYYRMELLVCQKSQMRMEILGASADQSEKNIVDCSIALVVINKAREAIPNNVSFLLEFLPICRLFDFTEKHEDDIFQLLIENYSNNELIWDAVARRKFHVATKTLADDSKFLPIHFKVCLETFEEVVKRLPTESMYTLYLNFCLEQQQNRVNAKAKSNLVKWALHVFDIAHEKNLLAVEMFPKWNDLLIHTGHVFEAVLVLESATKNYPSNVNLWCQLLNSLCLGGRENSSKILETFENALKVVKDKDCWPLWEIVWNYCVSFQNKKEIEKLFEKGLLHPEPQISAQIKTKYLIWVYLSQGIKLVRTHYKKFHKIKPITQDFFKEYINIEMGQKKLDMDNIRSAYNDALEVYGKDVDLWIAYMNLEMTHSEGKLDQLPMIYFKATKTLDNAALDEFIKKYTLFRSCLTES